MRWTKQPENEPYLFKKLSIKQITARFERRAVSVFPAVGEEIVGTFLTTSFSSPPPGCELYAFCGALFGICSMMTLMVIAVDRYVVITRPLASLGLMSRRKALGILAAAWVYSAGWSLPPFFGWSEFNGTQRPECSDIPIVDPVRNLVF